MLAPCHAPVYRYAISNEEYPDMTDQPRALEVHLDWWDDTFNEWQREASFRLHWRAEASAKALSQPTKYHPGGVLYRVVDERIGQYCHFWYRAGEELRENPVLEREVAQ